MDEISQDLEATKLERDLTMTNLRAIHEGQRKAKETYDAKSQALVKKLKGNSSWHSTCGGITLGTHGNGHGLHHQGRSNP